MSGWKARIGYLSPSVFETPSDWDRILPEGFTIVSSGLNVQSHTEVEFNKAIDALGAGLGIFKAEECDAILMGGITLGTQRGYAVEQEVVAKLSQQVGLPVSTAMIRSGRFAASRSYEFQPATRRFVRTIPASAMSEVTRACPASERVSMVTDFFPAFMPDQ